MASAAAAPTVDRMRGQARRSGRHHFPMAEFVARRVAAGLATLFVVSVLIFIACNVLPGNVAELVLGKNATPERVAALKVRLGLDSSLFERYLSWLGGILHGDFGNSAVALALNQPETSISGTLGQPLFYSLLLAGITAVILIPLTLVLGAIAGIYARRSLDHAISMPSLILGGLPEFVTGTFLIWVFFSVLHVLPPVWTLRPGESPLQNAEGLILPVLTLLAVALGAGIRQVRAGMTEVLTQDYVQFARLNGISERRVLSRYAMRNALAPSVQTIAQNVQYLLGGIIVVESLFVYPGLGMYLVQAVLSRDTSKVQAAALILAAIYIFINIVADIVVVYLVPRLRTAYS